jgi:putative ATPase
VSEPLRPLADRMRPQSIDEIAGQRHLLAPGRALRVALERGQLHSMILWGPPGTGKTTLARLFARAVDAEFIALSAVMAGVKDIRAAVEEARRFREQGRATVLFLDEVHRFNKAQQDLFLPFVEDGTIVFVGATTENPSFEVVSALLSRARVYVLKSLGLDDIKAVVQRALSDRERGLGGRAPGAVDFTIDEDALQALCAASDGDARRALGTLETAADLATAGHISVQTIQDLAAGTRRRFDKGGDQFFDQISALHKAVRGSDPDASLYWLARMLDGGADPAYLARRITRMAVEDIGLGDPRALPMALEAWEAFERLGAPEGELALAQCVVFLAVAPKSNAVYTAFGMAREDVEKYGTLDVPARFRNAPTKLMRELGHGQGYRYAHDEADAYVAGERYLPDEMPDRRYYSPVQRGFEIRIAEAMARRRALDTQNKDTDRKDK